jgi:hypothetical protein
VNGHVAVRKREECKSCGASSMKKKKKRREEFYIMKWFSVFSIKGILSLLLPLFSDCKVL